MHKSLIFLLLLAVAAALCACRPDTPLPAKPIPTLTSPTGEPGDPIAEDAQLIGKADTREDAQALAELYGITLVDFSHGYALFSTEEDPNDVIQRGRENGWPELTLNHSRQTS